MTVHYLKHKAFVLTYSWFKYNTAAIMDARCTTEMSNIPSAYNKNYNHSAISFL